MTKRGLLLAALLFCGVLTLFAGTARAEEPAGDCSFLEPDPQALPANLRRNPDGAVQSRLALVIGNGDYENLPPLKNPFNDASAVAKAFVRLGFDTLLLLDATAADIEACQEIAGAYAEKIDIGVVYYSGHGIQINDTNYIVGVDATSEGSAEGFYDIGRLADFIQSRSVVTLVFLDACRNNPFGDKGKTTGLSASLSRGLVPKPVKTALQEGSSRQARGVLLAYATSPNATADDGEGRHSPYTAAILDTLLRPGIPIQQTMAEVGRRVGEETGFSQTPWTTSSLEVSLRLAGELTAEQAQEQSSKWASISYTQSRMGEQSLALASALNGIPFPPDGDLSAYPFINAWAALDSALRTNAVKLPVGDVTHFALSKPGTRALVVRNTVARGTWIELWDTGRKAAVREVVQLAGTDNYLLTLTPPIFSPDGSRFAILTARGSFTVWDSETGETIRSFHKVADNQISHIDLNDDGSLVVASGGDRAVATIWNVDSGKVHYRIDAREVGRLIARAPVGDARRAIVNSIQYHSYALFESGGDISLFISCSCGQFTPFIFMVDMKSRQVTATLRLPPGFAMSSSRKGQSYLFSRDRASVIMNTYDNNSGTNSIRLYRLSDSALLFSIPNPGGMNIAVNPEGDMFSVFTTVGAVFYAAWTGAVIPHPGAAPGLGYLQGPSLTNALGQHITYDISRYGEAHWLHFGTPQELYATALRIVREQTKSDPSGYRLKYWKMP